MMLRELWGGHDVYVGGLLAVRSCPSGPSKSIWSKVVQIEIWTTFGQIIWTSMILTNSYVGMVQIPSKSKNCPNRDFDLDRSIWIWTQICKHLLFKKKVTVYFGTKKRSCSTTRPTGTPCRTAHTNTHRPPHNSLNLTFVYCNTFLCIRIHIHYHTNAPNPFHHPSIP